MTTHTLEAFPEAGSYEVAGYGEFEHEGEYEDEEFWGSLAGLARRAVTSPTLRRIGLTAARRAIAGLPSAGRALGQPGSVWSDLGYSAGRALSSNLNRRLPLREHESDGYGEFEINPIAKVYPAAVMEHLGRAAAEAKDEAQAESFIGALVPMAMAMGARTARRPSPSLVAATPQLIQGAANVTRLLRDDPATKPLVRAMPSIIRGATLDLSRQASGGRPVSPQTAVRTLANHTARTLTSPQRCLRAHQRSQVLDRRFHQALTR